MSTTENRSALPAPYRAFISYAHEDVRMARWLHRTLESFRVPKEIRQRPDTSLSRNGLRPIFLDRLELASSADLTGAIESALARSEYLIVICSPRSAVSERVHAEVEYFLKVHDRSKVLALLVAGRPNAVRRNLPAGEECLPPQLRGLRSDAADVAEPLAADVRKGRRSRAEAISMLAAGMLGVGLDTLRRRELQARQRRLAMVTAAACSLAGLTAALAGYAWNARAAALQSESRAALEAAKAKEVADFLISIFRVSSPSEAVGNAITARELLDRGAQQLRASRANANGVQGTFMLSIGTVYRELGLYKEARPLLEEVLRSRQSNPDSTGVDLADATYQLALLNAAADRRMEAEQQMRRSLEYLAPCEQQPAACALRHEALGNLFVRASRIDEALEQLKAAQRLQLMAKPGDSSDAARLLNSFGFFYREQGKFQEAERYGTEALAMQQRLHSEVHPDTAKAHYALALLYQEMKRYDKAELHVAQAMAIDEKVYGPDHPELLTTLQMVGILHAEQGDLAAARPFFERTLQLRERVLGPEHTEVGYAAYNLGHLYGDMSLYAQALELMRRAQLIWERAQGTEHPDVAYALDKQGEYLVRQGRLREAEPLIQRALKINLTSLNADHPSVARSQLNLARLRLAERRPAEAREALKVALSVLTAKYGPDASVVQDARTEFASVLPP